MILGDAIGNEGARIVALLRQRGLYDFVPYFEEMRIACERECQLSLELAWSAIDRDDIERKVQAVVFAYN